jgi:hypothetical protein
MSKSTWSMDGIGPFCSSSYLTIENTQLGIVSQHDYARFETFAADGYLTTRKSYDIRDNRAISFHR